jgi:hypothetical protein
MDFIRSKSAGHRRDVASRRDIRSEADMTHASTVEELLREAIAVLVSSGHPHTADHLRSCLQAILSAPTAAAKRRRVLHLVRTLERSETEARYRLLLRRILEKDVPPTRAA